MPLQNLTHVSCQGSKTWRDLTWRVLAHCQVLQCSSIDLAQAKHITLRHAVPSQVTYHHPMPCCHASQPGEALRQAFHMFSQLFEIKLLNEIQILY